MKEDNQATGDITPEESLERVFASNDKVVFDDTVQSLSMMRKYDMLAYKNSVDTLAALNSIIVTHLSNMTKQADNQSHALMRLVEKMESQQVEFEGERKASMSSERRTHEENDRILLDKNIRIEPEEAASLANFLEMALRVVREGGLK